MDVRTTFPTGLKGRVISEKPVDEGNIPHIVLESFCRGPGLLITCDELGLFATTLKKVEWEFDLGDLSELQDQFSEPFPLCEPPDFDVVFWCGSLRNTTTK